MKHLRIAATKLDSEGNAYVAFTYDYDGYAFANIINGYIDVYEVETHRTNKKLLKISDYKDVTIYNYD